jgi:soluble lytic murein transglycosylase-like protein
MKKLVLVIALLSMLCVAWVPEEANLGIVEKKCDLGCELTAQLTVRRCARLYLDIVENTKAKHDYSGRIWFPELVDIDSNLILAMMAKESHCIPSMNDGVSIGLMAVTPRSWTATKEELESPYTNIYWGMYFLDGALAKSGGDIRTALAAYNCGWESLNANKCTASGGYTYADDILSFWLPRFLQGDR